MLCTYGLGLTLANTSAGVRCTNLSSPSFCLSQSPCRLHDSRVCFNNYAQVERMATRAPSTTTMTSAATMTPSYRKSCVLYVCHEVMCPVCMSWSHVSCMYVTLSSSPVFCVNVTLSSSHVSCMNVTLPSSHLSCMCVTLSSSHVMYECHTVIKSCVLYECHTVI